MINELNKEVEPTALIGWKGGKQRRSETNADTLRGRVPALTEEIKEEEVKDEEKAAKGEE